MRGIKHFREIINQSSPHSSTSKMNQTEYNIELSAMIASPRQTSQGPSIASITKKHHVSGVE